MGVELGRVRLVGNPIGMSVTPATYRTAPPALGADDAVLGALGRPA